VQEEMYGYTSVPFFERFFILGGPRGTRQEKRSKFGLDYRFRKNKGDEIASMSRSISILV
jgi:hypothetical protein